MSTDPISDMLTIIRNGYLATKYEVEVPYSVFKGNLAKILVREGYLAGVKKEKNKLVLTLSYEGKVPKTTKIQRVSKPGLRIYVGKNNLPKVLGGLGIAIISTPVGLLTSREAQKLGLGGEVICRVW